MTDLYLCWLAGLAVLLVAQNLRQVPQRAHHGAIAGFRSSGRRGVTLTQSGPLQDLHGTGGASATICVFQALSRGALGPLRKEALGGC
jgi:hypothetical protein